MSHNIKEIEDNIVSTLGQLKITDIPDSFNIKLHQALMAEQAKAKAPVTITVLSWQKIMAMAAAFLLAISIGFISTEYLTDAHQSTEDLVGGEDTTDLSVYDRVDSNVIENDKFSFASYTMPKDIPNHKDVQSMAQLANLRTDIENQGYINSVGCSSLEECLEYLSVNGLDTTQCMVVGYIGETSYVILSNMESIVAGGASGLEGLVAQYEVFSK